MTALEALTAPQRPEPKRDRWGRPLVLLPGATRHQPLTRVTTIASTLADRFGLEKWAKRNVVLGIAARPDLYARACSVSADETQALNDIVEAAEEAAGASTGATMGTALHRFTERIDAGEDIPVPEPWDKDVVAYQQALQAHGIEIVPDFLECFVVNIAMGAAGTADRLVRWRNRLVVADLKTGKNVELSMAQNAIQLALYSHADTFYDPATDTHTPLPAELDRTVGLIIHLPVGQARCDIYEVDLVEGYRWAQVAVDVRGWRKSKPGKMLTLAAPAAPTAPVSEPAETAHATVFEVERARWLRDRLAYLKAEHPAALARLASVWPEDVPTFRSEHRHTPAELERIRVLVAQVEAAEQVPFPPVNCPPSRASLIERLKALPADLLDDVQVGAKAAGVPHLLGNNVTVEHLHMVAGLLDPAETQAEDRALYASQQLTGAGMTVTQVAGVIEGFDLDRITADQTTYLTLLCEAVADQVVDDIDGALAVSASALDALCDAHGKTVVRGAAKELAERHDRPRPRAAGDLGSDPLLFALTRAHLNQSNTKEAKENK